MIRNIDDLIANMCSTIESLQESEIEVEDAAVCAKLYDTVLNAYKLKFLLESKISTISNEQKCIENKNK